MRLLLNVILVLFSSFSITTLPVEKEFDDNDDGSLKSKSESTVSTWNITSSMNPEEIVIGSNTVVPTGLGRNGLADKSKLWPNGRIPISVEGSYTSEERELIIQALDTLDYWTCISFTVYDGQKDYLAIISIPDKGCNSSVGYQGGRQEVILETSKCFDKIGTVLHELLHAIGLIDEHRRPDRDYYVIYHEDNVKNGAEKYFQKYDQLSTKDYGVPYDFNSVMHLPENAYSRNGRWKTIEPKVRGTTIGQRDGMSVRDAIKVANMYQCFYELDMTHNASRILPISNETIISKDLLVVLYFKDKMYHK